MQEYIRKLLDTYSFNNNRTVSQAHAFRDNMRHVVEFNNSGIDNKIIRTSFFNSFILGYHVARKSLMDQSAERRANIADLLYQKLQLFRESIDENSDTDRVMSSFFSLIQDFGKKGYSDAQEYHEWFESHELEIATHPNVTSIARVGFGIPLALAAVARDAIIGDDTFPL